MTLVRPTAGAGFRSLVITLAACGSLWLAVPAQAADSGGNHPAVKARVLQTELMVSALYCDESGRYNAFVRKFRPELTTYGKQLQKLFADAHGPRAQPKLDQFVTRVANAESQRHIDDRSASCEDSAELFTNVLSLNRLEFRRFTDQMTVRLSPALLAIR